MSDKTTIQLSKDTLKQLKYIKLELDMLSNEDVIKYLMKLYENKKRK